MRACTRRVDAQTEITVGFRAAPRQCWRGILRVSPNPAAISTSPATTAAPELPPVKGSGWSVLPATVVDEPPSVTTVSESRVVVVAPGSVVVVVSPAVVTVETVVVVTAVVEVAPGTLEVVVVVDPPVVVVGGDVEVVDVSPGTVDVVTADEVVVFGMVDVVVVVDGPGVVHPLSNTPMPTDVQFLPAYFSAGPKSNGGMMSPHFVCLGIAG